MVGEYGPYQTTDQSIVEVAIQPLTGISTWVECATHITEIPTFVVPVCTNTPTLNITTIPTPTIPDMVITPAPTIPSLSLNKTYSINSTSCYPLWICIDALQICDNEVTIPYGAYVDLHLILSSLVH